MSQRYKSILSFVWTTDIEKSKTFYSNVLGMNVVFESDGWVELSIPGTQNAFIALNKWAQKGKHPVNEYLTLSVEGIDDFRKTLQARDVPLKGDMRDFPEQGLRMFKFTDPSGNILTAAEVEN
ncbi:MAG: hypothetical protein DRP59_08535 [Spirochaetes bacterium]|nr:MAG: hypothetical protein DRP59_08535 [Spirochaetota bacterium]